MATKTFRNARLAVVSVRLTMEEYAELEGFWPDLNLGQAVRRLIEREAEARLHGGGDRLIARERLLAAELAQIKEAQRTRQEAAAEQELEAEHHARMQAARKEAEQIRAATWSKLQGNILAWATTVFADPGADPRGYIESLGVDDATLRIEAVSRAEGVLQRLRSLKDAREREEAVRAYSQQAQRLRGIDP